MAIDHNFIKKVGPDAKEIESKAPWLANLKKNCPWLWQELEDFCAAPMEFVLIRLLDQTSDPWLEHYPNRIEALKMLYDIAKEYGRDASEETENEDHA